MGGEVTHTLTSSEMPKHDHYLNANYTSSTSHGHYGNDAKVATGINGSAGAAANPYTSYSGNSQAHNNLPPYLVVYI